jgi:hypothetical protein
MARMPSVDGNPMFPRFPNNLPSGRHRVTAARVEPTEEEAEVITDVMRGGFIDAVPLATLSKWDCARGCHWKTGNKLKRSQETRNANFRGGEGLYMSHGGTACSWKAFLR